MKNKNQLIEDVRALITKNTEEKTILSFSDKELTVITEENLAVLSNAKELYDSFDKAIRSEKEKLVKLNFLKSLSETILMREAKKNGGEIITERCIIRRKTSTKPSLIIEDPKIVPKKYKTIETVEKIDNKSIKEDLVEGKEVKGASLSFSESLELIDIE